MAASPSVAAGAGFGDTGRVDVTVHQEDAKSKTPLNFSEDEKLFQDREKRIEWIICRLMEDSGEFLPLPTFVAASIGDLDSVKQAITRGEDINEFNRGGWTPLMYAAYIGHNSVCKFLLDSGAKTELHDRYYRTALILAASCGNDKAVGTLLEYQANMNAQDKKGWNALFYAACLNHSNTVRVLLKRGADPNQMDLMQGITPFHLACASGHELMVQIFLEYGADLSLKTTSGDTARSLAALNQRVKIVDLLDSHRQGGSSSQEFSKKKEIIDLPNVAAYGFGGNFDKKKTSLLKNNPASQLAKVEEKPTVAVAAVVTSGLNANNPKISNGGNIKEPQRKFSVTKCRPSNLAEFLSELQLSKYFPLLEEQAVDLNSFLQLTDKDLKEVGIKLLGPRKKMTNAIARWHSEGPSVPADSEEALYADYQREKAENAKRKLQEVTEEMEVVQEKLEIQGEEYENLQKQLDACRKALDLCKDLMQANKNLVKLSLNEILMGNGDIQVLTNRLRKILNNSDEGIIKILGTTT